MKSVELYLNTVHPEVNCLNKDEMDGKCDANKEHGSVG
jgi:hypothetical protein